MKPQELLGLVLIATLAIGGVLGLIASRFYVVTLPTERPQPSWPPWLFQRELTTYRSSMTLGEAAISELTVEGRIDAGRITVRFSEPGVYIYDLTLTQEKRLPSPEIRRDIREDKLRLLLDSEAADLRLTLNPSIVTDIIMTSSVSSILLDADNNAVLRLVSLRSNVGEIEVRILAGSTFSRLHVETNIGSIRLSIDTSGLRSDATVNVESDTGAITLFLEVHGGVGSRIEASTGLGSVQASTKGFKSIGGNLKHLLLETDGFERARLKLDVMLRTSTGSIRITAQAS